MNGIEKKLGSIDTGLSMLFFVVFLDFLLTHCSPA